MKTRVGRKVILMISAALLITGAVAWPAGAIEQRDEVSYLRGPYNIAFFHRHNQGLQDLGRNTLRPCQAARRVAADPL